MKKAILPLILFFLFAFVGYGAETYTKAGGESGLYSGGNGIFTDSLTTETYTVSNTIDTAFIPLIADLDGDGNKDIVTLEGGSVIIRDSKDLNAPTSFVDSVTFPKDTDFNFEKLLLYDYDGDGYTEVHLLLPTPEVIRVYEYNGTEFYLEVEHNFSAYHFDGDCILGCSADGCAIVCDKNQAISNTWTFYGIGYDNSGFYPTTLIDYSYKEIGFTCFPDEPQLAIGDLTGDGTNEYIFTFSQYDSADLPNADGYVWVVSANINASGHLVLSDYTYFDTGSDDNAVDVSMPNYGCYATNYNNTRKLTAPAVSNFDGNPNTDEVVIAYDVDDTQGDKNSYNMILLDYDLDLIDQFGDSLIYYAQGELISNIIVADIFEETGSGDFCALAIADPTNNRIELMCASPYKTGLDYAFFYYYAPWNFSMAGYGDMPHDYQHLIHAVEVDNTNDNAEVLTTWGTFTPQMDDVGPLDAYGQLTLLWENDREGYAVVPVDYEGIGLFDIIGLSSTGILYIDDAYDNREPAFATDITIDPCPPTIKENSTISISFAVSDTEDDPIETWFTLWDGSGYLWNSTRQIVSSGDYVDFPAYTTSLNFTTVNGRLTIYIQDDDENNDPVNESYIIVVNEYGYEYGTGYSCAQETETVTISGSGEACLTNDDCEGNLVCRANICQQYTEDELIDAVLPPETVPTVLRPVIALVIIIMVIMLVLGGLREYGFTDSRSAIYVGGLVGIATWLVTVIFGLIPAWTVLVGILISGAFIGNKVLNKE